MNYRNLDIKLRNTAIKFQLQFNPQLKVNEIIKAIIAKLQLTSQLQNVNSYFKNNCLDKSKTFEQQGINQNDVEIEIEFLDDIDVTLYNQILGIQQLRCNISLNIKQLNSILLKKLSLPSDYSIIISQDETNIEEDISLIELDTRENLKYQVYSLNSFIYNQKYYQIKIDITNSIKEICKIIGDLIHVDSQYIILDQMDNNHLFSYYKVKTNTELQFKVVQAQNNTQMNIFIKYGQDKRSFTTSQDEKVSNLIHNVKKVFFPFDSSEIHVKLNFNDQELMSDKTIQQCKIINNCEIQLIAQQLHKNIENLQIQNGLTMQELQLIKLKVLYNGELREIFVGGDKCVIDLLNIFRNHFKIKSSQTIRLEYGNKAVQGTFLSYNIYQAYEETYKILIEEPELSQLQIQKLKIYFINKKQYVEFVINQNQTIEQFQKQFLIKNSYPKNQPCYCSVKDNNDPIGKDIKILDLNVEELLIEVKELINGIALNRINHQKIHFEVYLDQKISTLLNHLQVNNCKFYFNNVQIDQNLTFKEIEFYDQNIIEFEIIENNNQMIQIIVIENNQQQEIELNSQLKIKDLRNELHLKGSREVELISIDKNLLQDEQNLIELAKDGKLILEMRQVNKVPYKQGKHQSEILVQENKIIYSMKSQIVGNYQEATQNQGRNQLNQLRDQIKYQLNISLQGQIIEIEFEQNKKIKDLMQFIQEKYNYKRDIIIRYRDNVLNPSDPIPYTNEVIIVHPYVINVKIKIGQRNQIFYKKIQLHEKIGDIITKLVQQCKIKSDSQKLVMEDQILDFEKTIKELGIKEGAELNLLI